MPFRLSVEAEEDIVSIAEQGVRNFGSLAAKRYHDELFDVLDLIAASPRMTRDAMRFRRLSESIHSRLTW